VGKRGNTIAEEDNEKDLKLKKRHSSGKGGVGTKSRDVPGYKVGRGAGVGSEEGRWGGGGGGGGGRGEVRGGEVSRLSRFLRGECGCLVLNSYFHHF